MFPDLLRLLQVGNPNKHQIKPDRVSDVHNICQLLRETRCQDQVPTALTALLPGFVLVCLSHFQFRWAQMEMISLGLALARGLRKAESPMRNEILKFAIV